MKSMLVLLFVFQALASFAVENLDSDEDWLREGLATQISKFKRATFTPHPDDHGIVAVNCERELQWWGDLRVFHHLGDKIDWVARIPGAYSGSCGHYVLSCEWQYLEGLQRWVLEVFDSTHMGNGSLWVFELEGHDLRLLLHTTAVGRCWDPTPDVVVPPDGEARFEGTHLNATCRIAEGEKYESVYLTGTVVVTDAEGKDVAKKPYAATWKWDVEKGVFSRTPN